MAKAEPVELRQIFFPRDPSPGRFQHSAEFGFANRGADKDGGVAGVVVRDVEMIGIARDQLLLFLDGIEKNHDRVFFLVESEDKFLANLDGGSSVGNTFFGTREGFGDFADCLEGDQLGGGRIFESICVRRLP